MHETRRLRHSRRKKGKHTQDHKTPNKKKIEHHRYCRYCRWPSAGRKAEQNFLRKIIVHRVVTLSIRFTEPNTRKGPDHKDQGRAGIMRRRERSYTMIADPDRRLSAASERKRSRWLHTKAQTSKIGTCVQLTCLRANTPPIPSRVYHG